MGILRSLLEGRRIKDGIRAEAVVLSIGAPTSWARAYQFLARVRVLPPDRAPYRVEDVTMLVEAEQWPLPGDTLPIIVDRDHPERLRVLWSEARSRSREQIQRELDAALATGVVGPVESDRAEASRLRSLFSTYDDGGANSVSVELANPAD